MEKKTSTLAIVALVLSFFAPLFGLILGILALNKINNNDQLSGKGLAIAAIIVSAISMILLLFLFIIPIIAYFGVLDPGNMLPSRFTMSPGLDPIDLPVYDSGKNSLIFVVRNNLGRDIEITPDFLITKGDCESSGILMEQLEEGRDYVDHTGETITVPNNSALKVEYKCKNKPKDYLVEEVQFTYKVLESGIEHMTTGDMRLKIN